MLETYINKMMKSNEAWGKIINYVTEVFKTRIIEERSLYFVLNVCSEGLVATD